MNAPMQLPMRLVDFPLLKQVLSDSRFSITVRPVDNHWAYENIIPNSVAGFNPYHRKMFISERSSLNDWLKAGRRNDRKFNEGDHLVREVFFLIHDYLHAWAAAFIQNAVPKLGLGVGTIRPENFEDFVFCHLLTEAAATVGLDYWTLATMDFSTVVDCGSNHRQLAVAYREADMAEYHRFSPDFIAQKPAFFTQLAEFYCSGVFPGFTLFSLKRSQKIRRWIEHELRYGETQRAYTRAWLHHLSGGRRAIPGRKLSAPVSTNGKWKKDLMQSLGESLWKKVKSGIDLEFKSPESRVWRAPRSGIPNFRFTDVRKVKIRDRVRILDGPGLIENFDGYFSQRVSAFDFDSFPEKLRHLLKPIQANQDLKGLETLLKTSGARKLKSNPNSSPRDLLFLN